MALSMAAREVIYLIHLTDELKAHNITIVIKQPTIQVRVFEDNVGAVELAKLPKLRPRTKHIAIQFHHFRSWTSRGPQGEAAIILVQYIRTTEQQADILTKSIPRQQFQYLRRLMCGW
jgi:hypothetical protein